MFFAEQNFAPTRSIEVWENRSTFLMLDRLEQILKTGTIYRADGYDWNGMSYLRVFIVGRWGCVWDGPRTDKALSMIDEAKEAKRRQER